MTWREISPEKLNSLKEPIVVDVRSPCEHESERIPDSINIPLLSNEERASIGTIYAHKGEAIARREALRVIAPQIPAIVDQILALRTPGRALVVHCWRGGLRSEAVASFLSVVGIDCFRLTGGYKAWRRQIVDDLNGGSFNFRAVTLHGLTGVGKTEILKCLAERGAQVLDLEELANHRGSVFGSLGLGEQPTQKNFEAHLWKRLRTFNDAPIYLEAESRKIGRLSLPDSILKMIHEGRSVLVTGSMGARCLRIQRDYAGVLDPQTIEHAFASLSQIKERIGTTRAKSIKELVLDGRVSDALEEILADYYDPLYMRQIKKYEPFELTVDGDDLKSACDRILELADSWASVNF